MHPRQHNAAYYKLVDRRPVPARSLDEVLHLIENVELRRVALTEIEGHTVSTIFLVLNPYPFGTPRLFETMICDETTWLEYQDRSVTWEEAELAHALACEAVRLGLHGRPKSDARDRPGPA